MAELVFDHYTSSAKGLRFGPTGAPAHAALREDPRVFDKARYEQEIHGPVPVLATGDALRRAYPRCLDMPLRLKGQTEYSLPEEWAGLASIIQSLVSVEAAVNPAWARDYHTYLTVDCSMVEPGAQQRNGGLHVDGFQGARIQPKTKITRNYVATSNGGTRFYPQAFNTHWDEEVYDLFKGFDQQVQGEPLVAAEDTVWFMDAYTVHESGFALRPGLRTFLRLTFDCKEFDRLGNTRNAMLSYDWPMVKRDVHATLRPPPASSDFY